MKILDLNLLVYAVNRDSPKHPVARSWVETILAADEPIGFPWVVITGFLRISTSPRVFANSLTTDESIAIVDSWLAARPSVIVSPGPEHWRLLSNLLRTAGTAGNLTTDAHVAALAIENGAELCSTDTDFARFPGLRWMNPLAN
jgi:toxin-antitoxin system PIN domain toxin